MTPSLVDPGGNVSLGEASYVSLLGTVISCQLRSRSNCLHATVLHFGYGKVGWDSFFPYHYLKYLCQVLAFILCGKDGGREGKYKQIPTQTLPQVICAYMVHTVESKLQHLPSLCGRTTRVL